MKTLILYYSYGGNTRKVAQLIQEETGGQLEEIRTLKPYTGDYNSVVDRGKREVDSGYRPEILPIKADISDFDQVVLGTPVWWYTFAPAIKTYLEKTDFMEKPVYLFATNGGWLGHTLKDLEKECQGAKVKKGLGISFNENILKTSECEIKKWIKTFAKNNKNI